MAAGLGIAIKPIGQLKGARGGTGPHIIGRQGADHFVNRFESEFANAGVKLNIQQFERELRDKYGIRRIMDVHLLDTKSGRKVFLRYEIKTNTGKLTPNQKHADDLLRQEGKELHYVHVDLRAGTIKINGRDPSEHFADLRARLIERSR